AVTGSVGSRFHPDAEGVAQQSPGSPKAHPGCRSTAPPQNPVGVPHGLERRCPASRCVRFVETLGVRSVPRKPDRNGCHAFPGCAERPRALMGNAFGVKTMSHTHMSSTQLVSDL